MKHFNLSYILGSIVISVVEPNSIQLLPRLVNVVENSSVTLTCSKNNGLLIETIWMKSDIAGDANLYFLNGQCIVTRFLVDTDLFDGFCNGNGTYSVVLKKINRKQHGVEWRCTEYVLTSNIVSIQVLAENDTSNRSEAPCNRSAAVPAVIVVIHSDEKLYMRENQTQTVRCQTSPCRPNPTVKWYLQYSNTNITYDITENSTQSYSSQEYGLMAAESILQFVPNRTLNNWHLFCEVWTQPEKSDISSKTIVVNVLYPPEGPPVIHGFKNGTVHRVVESESGTVNCSVIGGNPLATLTLTCFNKQSTTVTITNTTVTSYISWKAMRNQSECTCESNHVIGGKQITYLKFEVMFPPSEVSFTISGRGSEGGTNNSEDVTFVCSADSNPKSDIIIKDQRNKRLTIFKNASFVNFTIHKVSCDDAGEYTCYARNIFTVGQEAKSKLILFVRCPPRPKTVKDDNVTALLRSDVTLQFTAHDFFDVQNKTVFTWYKQNTSLQNGGSKHIISSYGLQSVIIIRNITQRDYGQYRVIVRNSFGQYIHYYELHIKEHQEPENSTITGTIIGVAVGTFAFTILVVVLSLIGYKYFRRNHSLERSVTQPSRTFYSSENENDTASENQTTSTYDDINLGSDPKTVYEQLGDKGREGPAYMEMQTNKAEETSRDYINMTV